MQHTQNESVIPESANKLQQDIMQTQKSELRSLEGRVNTLPMYASDREMAIGAARVAFIIVERIAWAMHGIRNVGAFLMPRTASVN